jgi:hypothetical protein
LKRLGVVLLFVAAPLASQDYRLRVDARFQSVSFRGVQLDSIPATAAIADSNGSLHTPDGFAVVCLSSEAYCTYFRPGPIVLGAPLVTSVGGSVWGFGVRGLSAHGTARLGTDLGSEDAWPGTEPALQLVEGYMQYAAERVTATAGRQIMSSRLGTTGFDGAHVTWRMPKQQINIAGYLGWGLARGVALPVTSPALNPLDDFQPRKRQIIGGLEGVWTSRHGDARFVYQREVDPQAHKFVSERLAFSGAVRPAAGWVVSGGGEYDIAAGWWGSADLSVGYATRTVSGLVEARRYRPHFDLWTIWGAFSPVPYHSLRGSVSVRPTRPLQLHARGEVYRFDPAEVSAPLVPYENDGYRAELGATFEPKTGWIIDAGYNREFGPGAALVGGGGSITYAPTAKTRVTVYGQAHDRPLEFRYSESSLRVLGFDGGTDLNDRVRFSLGAMHYDEERDRPDAAAFDWTQWRLSAGVTVLFAHGGDLENLPPAIRRMPSGRNGAR